MDEAVAWAPERLSDEAPWQEPQEQPRPSPAEPAMARSCLADFAAAPPMQVLRWLDSTCRGLDEAAAQARLARFGDNAIIAASPPRWEARVLAAARNPFVVILICLTAVSTATGDLAGAAMIIAMVVLSCALRVRQEYRSDRAAAALRAMVATTATVVRRASAGLPSGRP